MNQWHIIYNDYNNLICKWSFWNEQELMDTLDAKESNLIEVFEAIQNALSAHNQQTFWKEKTFFFVETVQ